jgi:hypothetical protein
VWEHALAAAVVLHRIGPACAGLTDVVCLIGRMKSCTGIEGVCVVTALAHKGWVVRRHSGVVCRAFQRSGRPQQSGAHSRQIATRSRLLGHGRFVAECVNRAAPIETSSTFAVLQCSITLYCRELQNCTQNHGDMTTLRLPSASWVPACARAQRAVAASSSGNDVQLSLDVCSTSRRTLLAGTAAACVSLSGLPAQAVQGLTAGRIPGATPDPDMPGIDIYKRPLGKSGGHGVGWSEIPQVSSKALLLNPSTMLEVRQLSSAHRQVMRPEIYAF